jgi:phosphatidylserine decarboxylase
MFAFIIDNLLWSQSPLLLAGIAASGLLGLFWHRFFLMLAVALLIFAFYFFRNPHRVITPNFMALYAPADGTIVDWAYDAHNGLDGYNQRISIFLSPFDVHVQRAPIAGRIEEVVYKSGTFMPAFLPKSSELNERNDVVFIHPLGTIKVRQISGTIARCIVCWYKPRAELLQGDRYGMIKFGSRVDLFLPSNVKVSVKKGQRVMAGLTVIGHWVSDPKCSTF